MSLKAWRYGGITALIIVPAALGCLALAWRHNPPTPAEARGLFFAALMAAFVVGHEWAMRGCARASVQRWAREQGYAVLRFQSPFLAGGFSWFTTARSQVVYLVTIRNREGVERKAWVRCGGFLGGALFSHQAQVKWQDEAGRV